MGHFFTYTAGRGPPAAHLCREKEGGPFNLYRPATVWERPCKGRKEEARQVVVSKENPPVHVV